MNFHILTIFPKIFDSYLNEGILARAQKNNFIKVQIYDLRNWTQDKHRSVDDSPYGGGAGMVMKIEPIYNALQEIKSKINPCEKTKTILLSARGKIWDQVKAKKYVKIDNLIFICGRYEGVDERIKKFIDAEISIGEYVLTGGELPALVIIDSISRLLPNVLGNDQSARDESYSQPGVLEYPQYTRPSVFEIEDKKYSVPKILLGGNHKEIDEWRTKKRRRD